MLHDGVGWGLVDAAGFHTQEGGLEECLWMPELLVADGDHQPVPDAGWCGEGYTLSPESITVPVVREEV